MFFRRRFTGIPSYHDYLPLNGAAQKADYRVHVFALFTLALVATSFVFNIINIVKWLYPLPRPFDDYQNLNVFPFWDDATASTVSSQENAIVTALFSDSYAPAVAALGHSLQRVNTTARLIVLYFPSKITPSALCLATSSGFQPHLVERISPPRNGKGLSAHFQDTYTKLSLWTLDAIGVRRLVFLDADTLVVHNFDEIFGMPYRFAAAPDVWEDWRGFTLEFNTGVMFLRPNSTVYEHMMDTLPTARFPQTSADQDYLNQYFAADAVRLPLVYNGNLAAKYRYPKVWAGMQDTMRIIHYTLAKPFVGPNPSFDLVPIDLLPKRVRESAQEKHGAFKEEVELWGRTWEETRTLYAREIDKCFESPAHTGFT